MQKHKIVIPRADGGVEVYPMKEWLRQHPDLLPSGVETTTSTSHELRRVLKRQGWVMKESPHEISLFPPGADIVRIEAITGAESEETASELDELAFGLEHELRDFIAVNLNAIDVNGRRLSLYKEPTGRDGVEFPTEVGFIDILATDQSGGFFVFELKRASSPDRAIGQLTRYMGWVKHTMSKDRDVNGVIVAKTINDRLRYAASVVPNVHLFQYEVDFHLKPAHLSAVTPDSDNPK
jgi:endonuclease